MLKKKQNKDSYQIVLTMDNKRAEFLSMALECIARIGVRQFKDMVELLKPMTDWNTKQEIETYLKDKIDSNKDKSLGIQHDEVPEVCQVSWDAYQTLRRELSWRRIGKDWRKDSRDWETMMGVGFDEPMKVSKLEGGFKTEIIENV